MDLGSVLVSSFARAPWGWALLATSIIALIKVWPILAEQALRAKAAIRSEKRSDMSDLRARVTQLETKVETASAAAHRADLKLVSALAAYRLIASELQKLCPDSPILKQAQELLNVSYPSPREMVETADVIRPLPVAGTP